MHDILLDVEENTRKTTYIEIAKHRNPADPVTKGEEKQLRSVVRSLSWKARQARPDILYRVSKLQSSIKGATVSTLKEANKVLELALNGMDLKLRQKNGPFNFQELGILTASDASFAGEAGSKSQQGRIHFLVPAYQLLAPKCCDYDVVIVSFSSTTIKRVCRATLQAETYALQNAQEAGDRVRALLGELYGYGTTGPDWRDASRRAIPHVMLSDCRSLVPSRVQDKRLQIELDAMRQSIFDGHGRRTAEVYPKGGDRVYWVATATQIADCLAKSMKPIYMLKVLSTCQYQISREGYSKPGAEGEATVPKGQEELESAQTESARRPPQVDYVLLFGPTEKGKIWHAIFLRFEPGFSALVFHGVSFTHSGCFISGCHVQLQFAPAPSHDSWPFWLKPFWLKPRQLAPCQHC